MKTKALVSIMAVAALALPAGAAAEKPTKADKENAARECKAERADPNFAATHDGKTFEQFYGKNKNGKNAYGKCVSTKAKQKKAEMDAEDATS